MSLCPLSMNEESVVVRHPSKMRVDEFASRLKLLSSASQNDKPQLAQGLKEDLASLEPVALGELICLCASLLEPRSLARIANRMLLKALEGKRSESGESNLSFEKLIHGGASICNLVQISQSFPLDDLPPCPQLVEKLVAILLAWDPFAAENDAVKGGRENCPILFVLTAVKEFRLAAYLPEPTAEALLRHAIDCDQTQLTSKKMIEAGDVIPEWRRLILKLVLPGNASSTSRSLTSDLVRIAQRWGAHEDPEVFSQLRHLLATEHSGKSSETILSSSDAAHGYRLQNALDYNLPQLQLESERVILLDGCADADASLASAVEKAENRLSNGGCLWVALDAEWEDPRPISLLQLALSSGEVNDVVEIYLYDALASHSSAVLQNVRWLLRGGARSGAGESAGSRHEVLVFGAHEDKRRLGVSGLLPEFSGIDWKHATDSEIDKSLGWIDLQSTGDWGLGVQPSLRNVVAKELGAFLDKSLQQSHWDQRPLSEDHISYAALDSSVLLRLRRRYVKCSKDTPSVSKNSKKTTPTVSSRDDERARWAQYLCKRNSEDERSFDRQELRFVLPASLAKLMRKMRGLGLDTIILEEGSSQRDLGRVALAEDRIILTRSGKMQLSGGAASKVYLLQSKNTDGQLRELIDIFGVEVQSDNLCGRCIKCNSSDWRFACREDVKDHPDIKPNTLEAYSEFWICGGCGKVFWEGGMFEKAVAHYRTFLPDGEVAITSALGESYKIATCDGQQECREDDCGFEKYKEMGREGCSTQRIRAQMVRDGVLDPGGCLPEEVIAKMTMMDNHC